MIRAIVAVQGSTGMRIVSVTSVLCSSYIFPLISEMYYAAATSFLFFIAFFFFVVVHYYNWKTIFSAFLHYYYYYFYFISGVCMKRIRLELGLRLCEIDRI